MFGDRLKRYSGLIGLIAVLVIFIILVVGLGAYLNANVVQREAFARAKTGNFVEVTERVGYNDPELRREIYEHLVMFRDGGRLATAFGPVYDYPPVRSEVYLSFLAEAIDAYEAAEKDQDWETFRQAYIKFDTDSGEFSQERSRLFVAIQWAAIGIISFGFFGILALLFFRLGKADDEALAVRRENDHILASTKEGVFLIDSEFNIGEQKSGAVQSLFGDKVEVQGNFLDFIKRLVPSKDFERVEKFLGLVFGGRAKPRLMGDLNPLQNVELTADRKLGGAVRRILNFDFSRDEQSDTVDKLLVTVSDITQQAVLREELEATQETQDERLKLLKGILHVDPSMLEEFIDKGKSSYTQINELLEEGSLNPDNNVERLDEIARIAHRLKGDAASLRLELFQGSIHRFEDTIDDLRKNNLLDGQSLLKLVVLLKNMIAELDLARSLTAQYSMQSINEASGSEASASSPQDNASNESFADTFEYKLSSLADEVALRNGKQVNFSINGKRHLDDAPSVIEPLTEIAVQLVRNAVLHGIETPEGRLDNGKPSYGKVHISIEQADSQLSMQVVDDGQGLDYSKIKQRALEKGLIDQGDADNVDQKRLLQIMFSHGFSSRTEVNQDGGRGVGLDAIKSLVNEHGGRINVGSVLHKQTSFTVHLPTLVEGE